MKLFIFVILIVLASANSNEIKTAICTNLVLYKQLLDAGYTNTLTYDCLMLMHHEVLKHTSECMFYGTWRDKVADAVQKSTQKYRG